MRMIIFTATAVLPSLALADVSTWNSWSVPTSVPVTTTITKTLLHFNYNETTTMTLSSPTGNAFTVVNVTATATGTGSFKPTLTPSSTTAAIATFSSGSASVPEMNAAIAAIAGIGAVAYGLY